MGPINKQTLYSMVKILSFIVTLALIGLMGLYFIAPDKWPAKLPKPNSLQDIKQRKETADYNVETINNNTTTINNLKTNLNQNKRGIGLLNKDALEAISNKKEVDISKNMPSILILLDKIGKDSGANIEIKYGDIKEYESTSDVGGVPTDVLDRYIEHYKLRGIDLNMQSNDIDEDIESDIEPAIDHGSEPNPDYTPDNDDSIGPDAELETHDDEEPPIGGELEDMDDENGDPTAEENEQDATKPDDTTSKPDTENSKAENGKTNIAYNYKFVITNDIGKQYDANSYVLPNIPGINITAIPIVFEGTYSQITEIIRQLSQTDLIEPAIVEMESNGDTIVGALIALVFHGKGGK